MFVQLDSPIGSFGNNAERLISKPPSSGIYITVLFSFSSNYSSLIDLLIAVSELVFLSTPILISLLSICFDFYICMFVLFYLSHLISIMIYIYSFKLDRTSDYISHMGSCQQLHGHVFRLPINFGLLCVYVGTRVQFFVITLATMIFALLGSLSLQPRRSDDCYGSPVGFYGPISWIFFSLPP
ncbi:hypothetical protein GW17_00022036 [Ensete ventricosum]|nr:hypothetical protein GW17_00022036 [Ensete ventricosum]